MTVAVVPLFIVEAKAFVAAHHRHHKAPVGGLFACAVEVDGVRVAVAVVSRPSAPALAKLRTVAEVTRVASIAEVAVNASSRLYSACATAALALGYRRCITYTRADESGTSLRAANWRPTATTKGAPWTGGNKALRWLPGLYEPSTEIVDRVRWEFGPDAPPELATLATLGRRK